MSMLFQTNSSGTNMLFAKDDSTQRSYRAYQANGVISFQIWVAGSAKTAVTTGTYNDGASHLLTCTQLNDVLYIYVDGVLDGSTAGGSIDNDPVDFYIGATATPAGYFDGSIFSTVVFNTSLDNTDTTDKAIINGGVIPYKYIGASQTEQTSGTLTIGKAYRINDWITNDDFTNIGGANVDGSEFVATGTTPTTWTNSSTVVPIGAVLQLEQDSIAEPTWYDKSGNELHGTVSGAIVTNPAAAITKIDDDPTVPTLVVTGDIIPTGAGSGLAYGGIAAYSNTTATASPGAEQYTIVQGIYDEASPVNAVAADYTAGTLTVTNAGVYLVNVSVAFFGQNGDTVDFSIFKDGSKISSLHVTRKLGSNDVGVISISGLLEMAASGYIDLRCESYGGDSVTVDDVNMSLVQVGG